MQRIPRSLGCITASFLLTGAVAPLYGSASAMAARGNDKVPVHLVNKGEEIQDIKVDGRIYLVQPHASLDVKVPVGSVVYAAGKSAGHQDGDKLITITPEMKGTTVYFNCVDCMASGS